MQIIKTDLRRNINLNIPIPNKETELVFKKYPQRKAQTQISSLTNNTKYSREELIPIIHKL